MQVQQHFWSKRVIKQKHLGIPVVSPSQFGNDQFANVSSQFANAECQFANAYIPVTSGANVQNTFSFVSAVDERTRNKLYGIKWWVHIFSSLFGSAVDKRTRNNWYVCKGKKWPCIL